MSLTREEYQGGACPGCGQRPAAVKATPHDRGVESSIVGFDGVSQEELHQELEKGARFVVYHYCLSLLIVSFKVASPIHFIRSNQSRLLSGVPYSLISLIAGIWGIPFGIVYTIRCILSNSRGGTDVTDEVVGHRTAAPVAWKR
jgi:hypothetical protein